MKDVLETYVEDPTLPRTRTATCPKCAFNGVPRFVSQVARLAPVAVGRFRRGMPHRAKAPPGWLGLTVSKRGKRQGFVATMANSFWGLAPIRQGIAAT